MMYARSRLYRGEEHRRDIPAKESGPEVYESNRRARHELHVQMHRRGMKTVTSMKLPTEFDRWSQPGSLQSPARGRIDVQQSGPFLRQTIYSAPRKGMPPHVLEVGVSRGDVATVGRLAAYAEVNIQQETGQRSRHSALLLQYFFLESGRTTITGVASVQDAAEFELANGLWQATGLHEAAPLPAPGEELNLYLMQHAVGPVAIRGLVDYLVMQPPLPGAAAP